MQDFFHQQYHVPLHMLPACKQIFVKNPQTIHPFFMWGLLVISRMLSRGPAQNGPIHISRGKLLQKHSQISFSQGFVQATFWHYRTLNQPKSQQFFSQKYLLELPTISAKYRGWNPGEDMFLSKVNQGCWRRNPRSPNSRQINSSQSQKGNMDNSPHFANGWSWFSRKAPGNTLDVQ